ncbi:hypothetical protein [Streptomyces sp. NPDC087270]|uniref:hypothetical protein n=1 Tax=Streptomyces sp. NPDC087270 TaxID=3365774 RepID=UPI00381E0DED
MTTAALLIVILFGSHAPAHSEPAAQSTPHIHSVVIAADSRTDAAQAEPAQVHSDHCMPSALVDSVGTLGSVGTVAV